MQRKIEMQCGGSCTRLVKRWGRAPLYVYMKAQREIVIIKTTITAIGRIIVIKKKKKN